MVHTTLMRSGYKIKKSELTIKELKEIKNDLTANPFVVGDFGNGNEKRFNLYMESPNSIYIPRFYAYDRFGPPDINKMDEGETIDFSTPANVYTLIAPFVIKTWYSSISLLLIKCVLTDVSVAVLNFAICSVGGRLPNPKTTSDNPFS